MKKVLLQNIGLIGYKECWDFQENLLKENISLKRQNINIPANYSAQSDGVRHSADQLLPANYLLFCEHPHVYTLGKNGSEKNILFSEERLKAINATYVKTNRGGDITYHGPGQIVGYPILDLEQFFTDISRYMRSLEEVIIRTLREFGIESSRLTGSTGVWLEPDNPRKARKICAMGVRTSRWVTMHGFALNVNTDLSYFNHIVPCGITDKSVTSMEKELGKKMSLDIVRNKLTSYFAQVFECTIVNNRHTIDITDH